MSQSSAPAGPADPAAPGTAAADTAAPSAGRLVLQVFPAVMLPMFLAAVDQTIVATALPSIAGSLGDVERVSWVVISYLVATTIAAPVYGRLGDVLGRKRMMLGALAVFIGASLLCAAAPTMLALSAARVLQGLGGGGLMTLAQALIGEAVPPRQRIRYQAWFATIFMTSSTFGPVAGGWLTAHYGWRSVFLINLPLGLLAMLLALRLPRRAAGGGRFRFDTWGTLFFALSVTPLLLALERLQRFDRSALPLVVALVALSAVSVVLLLRQERRAASPLLPLSLFRQPAVWRTDLMAACVGGILVSLVTFLPIYLQVVRGAGPSRAGLLMLPLTACIALGSMATGRLVAWTGRTAIWPSCGLVVVTVMLLVLAFVAPQVSTERLPWLFAVQSLAMGTAMPVIQLTVQIAAGPKLLGSAAASVQFSRSIGAALGTAIVGAVLFASLAAADPHTAALFADMVERGPGVLATLDPAARALVRSEIADGFRAAFLTTAAFGAAALGLAWSIPVRRL